MRSIIAAERLFRLASCSSCFGSAAFRRTSSRTFSTTKFLTAGADDGTTKPGSKGYEPPVELSPMERIIKFVKTDTKGMWDTLRMHKTDLGHLEDRIFPNFCDILIIGGGIMGSAVAYYMKERVPESFTIVVVEKDPSYAHAASTNSMGTIRVQFSDELNVKAALFGAEFLRTMTEKLKMTLQISKEPNDILFNPQGFLFLGTQADVAQMEVNHETQMKAGAKVALLTPDLLRDRYPWMNFEDIALASYGLENEGWYDTWKLLYALKEKNMSWGIYYVHGEVVDFKFDNSYGDHYVASVGGQRFERLKDVIVVTPDRGTQVIQFAYSIIAAGHESGNVAKLTGLGAEKGLRILPLPIEKRKRYMYAFHCPDGPRLSFPILVDPNGLFVRRHDLEGTFMCSWTPKTNEQEPDPSDPFGNEAFFRDVLWPKLAFRVPAFEKLQLLGAWATFYDYNYFDQAGVVGQHPYYHNLLFATGFSGYGIQMAPAVGKAIQDLILEKDFVHLNMDKWKFDRFVDFVPAKESVLV
ncbi:FAD-dependent oxidoreductase domain-containing protein 1 [Hypsibius exemplaris]|uniref:FAD-dependent oxidoreductase domain-containing protein 1 n=1 Tax=Hypsibius exemplaris TaxID=2072580 RepID=A0A9X6NAT1_HYPEX|nr:FAD-dependent oxidoreductase domain-containing protein 1 [Hypsibius exemplaris]